MMAGRFAGRDHLITVDNPQALDFAAGSFTIELSIRVDNFIGIDAPVEGIRILGDEQLADADCYPSMAYWVFGVNPSGFPVFELGGQAGQTVTVRIYTATTAVATNTWAHVAMVVDRTAGEVTLYVDGALAGTTPIVASTVTNMCTFRLSTHHNPFSGELDEVRLWSRSRSAAELASEQLISLSGCEPGLAAYWPFETDVDDHGPSRLPASVRGTVPLVAR